MKAFLFPGQGSQKVGMGAELFGKYKNYVDSASDVLGYCIKKLCLEDSNGQLGQTQFTQPALYFVSGLMYLDAIDRSGIKPDVVAGHSLGEYNALFAAGAFTFEAGLELVKKRAELMGQSNGGSMAAIMGCTANEIKGLLKEVEFQGLDIASVNSSKQVVISGLPELISKVAAHFETSDAQCYPLNVSAAFHSRYMKPASDNFSKYLNEFQFNALQIPVISNVYTRPYQDAEPAGILASQIYSPVLWEESVQYMMAMGVDEFEEVGPGKVLTNMQRSISANPTLELRESNANIATPHHFFEEKKTHRKNIRVLSDATNEVERWNKINSIGLKVRLEGSSDIYKTSSEAVVLFNRKAVIYLENTNGFLPLGDVYPLN